MIIFGKSISGSIYSNVILTARHDLALAGLESGKRWLANLQSITNVPFFTSEFTIIEDQTFTSWHFFGYLFLEKPLLRIELTLIRLRFLSLYLSQNLLKVGKYKYKITKLHNEIITSWFKYKFSVLFFPAATAAHQPAHSTTQSSPSPPSVSLLFVSRFFAICLGLSFWKNGVCNAQKTLGFWSFGDTSFSRPTSNQTKTMYSNQKCR